MNVKPIASIVEFLRPIADEVGVEIVDCVFDRRTQSLTFYIDAEGLKRLESDRMPVRFNAL